MSPPARLRRGGGDMKRFLLVPVLLILLMLLPPSRASAQVPDEGDTPVTIRVNGDVRVVPDETVETLVVVRGTALVEGTVTKLLLVVDGDAVVSGRVDGDLTMVRSDLELQPSAVVTDVNLIFSDLVRADGATVTGEVDEIAAWESFSVGRGFFWFLWFSATVLVLVAGLLFAATGGRQLTEAATMIRSAPGPTLLATLLTWIVLPVAAVLAFITLVGIPVGFAIL